MNYNEKIHKLKVDIKLLEKDNADKISRMQNEILKLEADQQAAFFEQKKDSIVKLDKYLKQLSDQLFYRPLNGGGIGEGIYFTILPFSVESKRFFATVQWQITGILEILYTYLPIDQIDDNSVIKIKGRLFSNYHNITKIFPTELRDSNKKAIKVLEKNYNESFIPVAYTKDAPEKKMLTEWIKSYYIDYVDKAAKAHKTATKFGI